MDSQTVYVVMQENQPYVFFHLNVAKEFLQGIKQDYHLQSGWLKPNGDQMFKLVDSRDNSVYARLITTKVYDTF